MSRTQYLPADALRLEVETDTGGLVNLVQNPNGELGGWGWVTPVDGSTMRGIAGPALEYRSGPGVNYFRTENIPLTESLVRARYMIDLPEGGTYQFAYEWVDAAGAVTVSVVTAPSSAGSPGVFVLGGSGSGMQSGPVGTVAVRLRFNLSGAPKVRLKAITLIESPVLVSTFEYIAPVTYVDVLGSTNTINIDREELNVGTLTAIIIDSALDPAQAESDLLPGRRIRCMARIPETGFDDLDYGEGLYGGAATEWEPLFTGKIEKPTVKYNLLHPNPAKRSRITITAVDPLTPLAREGRSEGVATIDELPYVLEGAGIPWNVNGSGDQVPTATVVSINDNASAVDQVAITRDTALGYAWVDRFGILQAWDADVLYGTPANDLPPANIDPPGGVVGIDESDYGSDLDVDFDTDRCINQVKVTVLLVDPVTGDPSEIVYGPYQDDASIRKNQVHSATYTVHGLADADVPGYAAAILAANAWPRKRINSCSIPVRRMRAIPKVLIDIGNVLQVSNQRAGIDEPHRVTGVRHTISASSKGTRWTLGLSFAGTDRVAPAQVVPSPTPGGGKTQAELYRPVGEVTMHYGLVSQVQPGWLVMNGSAYDVTAYPKLKSHLDALVAAGLHGDATLLPNMIDRFPIGAGIKSVGTSGGDPTKIIATANLPAHNHSMNHTHTVTSRETGGQGGNANSVMASAGASATINNTAPSTYTGDTGNTGGADPLDVMPPWRAVHFIIRAV